MCGVTGFFVGCEFASWCRDGLSPCRLLKAERLAETWYDAASVRRAPRRHLDGGSADAALFPESLAPVTAHPLVRALDGPKRRAILNNHLFRYLDFTTKLELAVVNDVVKDLVFGHFHVALDADAKLCAHQIYLDEAYHALFSYDLLQQAEARHGQAPVLPPAPGFMVRLHKMLSQASSERERRLIRLFFVIVSETLVTASLSDIRGDAAIERAVRQSVGDHAIDEARHQQFFAGLLVSLWPDLPAADRALFLRRLPDFVFAFVEPDTTAILAELTGFGLSREDASQVLGETYGPADVAAYARACSSFLLGTVSRFDEFQTAETRDPLEATGLL